MRAVEGNPGHSSIERQENLEGASPDERSGITLEVHRRTRKEGWTTFWRLPRVVGPLLCSLRFRLTVTTNRQKASAGHRETTIPPRGKTSCRMARPPNFRRRLIYSKNTSLVRHWGSQYKVSLSVFDSHMSSKFQSWHQSTLHAC